MFGGQGCLGTLLGTLIIDPVSTLYLSKGTKCFPSRDSFELNARALDKKKNNAIANVMANESLMIAYDCNVQRAIND